LPLASCSCVDEPEGTLPRTGHAEIRVRTTVCASVDCLWHLAAPIADKASGLFTNRVRPGSAVWPVSRPGPALSLALAIPPRRYCLIAAATAARRMRPPSLFSSYRTDTAPCRTGTAQRGLTGFAAVSRACTRKVRGDGRAEVRPRERMGANGSARRLPPGPPGRQRAAAQRPSTGL